ncbi:MAG TPA: helix-turn-helix transcriptional regulator [Steroidobacteraceae bacterium]|nr:helix-turn-helix transcriptional regulator [Steroidobacteraceae bacterium]HJY41710.1 helix-turn-helix transcriptional regulator [Steroidobacteraceae bacterium]
MANNINEPAAHGLFASGKDIIPNGDPPAELQWPFIERRKSADRRLGDRRKGERRKGDRRQQPPPSAREISPSFTGREREIVDLLMQGMSNRQIAHTLGIAEATVKKHLHHVYRKFGVRSRALLIVGQSSKKR